MATTQTIAFKGTFDATQVLNSLKQIKAQMQNVGASNDLFKNTDKQIKEIEILVRKMQEQIQKGFANNKEITSFEKDLDKLSKSLQGITKDFSKINNTDNFSFNTENIEKANAALDKAKQKLVDIQKQQKTKIANEMTSLGYDPSTAEKWAKVMITNQATEADLVNILKEEFQLREQNYESAKKMQKETAKQAAKDVGSNAVASLNMAGFSATSGKSGAGKNDWRSRDTSGNLKKVAGKNTIGTTGETAIIQAYAKALEEASQDASQTRQIFDKFQQTLEYNGIAIDDNIIKFKDFRQAVKEMATAIRQTTEEQQANVDIAQNAMSSFGYRDENNNIQLINSGLEGVSTTIQQITEAETEVEQATQNVTDAIRVGAEQGATAQQDFANAIDNANQTIENQNTELHTMTQNTREAGEAQAELNQNFDNIKNYVKSILSIGSALTSVKSIIRDTFQSVQELDQNFASIAMVTDYSVADMWGAYNDYANMANELGQQTKDVIASSALFYQQGKVSVLFI